MSIARSTAETGAVGFGGAEVPPLAGHPVSTASTASSTGRSREAQSEHHAAWYHMVVPTPNPIESRVDALDWPTVARDLDAVGLGLTDRLLHDAECRELIDGYDDDARFRSTIDMARYRFGAGQYRYFAHPLPEIVARLRAAFWPHLLGMAREWAQRSGVDAPWPDDFDEWLAHCHAPGQQRPTPLILRYGPGDWNALHRDIYGACVFPLQVIIGLDEPGEDFTGGELVLVEQRPRAQSRATVTTIPRGHAAIITTRDRPVRSARGWSKASMRHGVSTVHTGRRHTLGLLFHDAS
jgi:hypothetical protein